MESAIYMNFYLKVDISDGFPRSLALSKSPEDEKYLSACRSTQVARQLRGIAGLSTKLVKKSCFSIIHHNMIVNDNIFFNFYYLW
jgi:hypothetical protein